MSVPGFSTLVRRHGVEVTLPDGRKTRGLYDIKTKVEPDKSYESQLLAGTPSIVLQEQLTIGQKLTINVKNYTIRDLETDPDGQLTRYFLSET